MAPKRAPKRSEPGEASKNRARKARSTGSSEQPSSTRRVTRRSNPVLVESSLEDLPDIPRRKKARKVAAEEKGKSVADEVNNASIDDGRKIIIEFCKQCNSIRTRAIQVKNGLEAGLPSIKVVLNPEKPRFGCFEIREDGGDAFFTLLNMKRPFKDLKAVDIDELVSGILKKLK